VANYSQSLSGENGWQHTEPHLKLIVVVARMIKADLSDDPKSGTRLNPYHTEEALYFI